LANFKFKVITKILVDRLAQVVPYTISHQKSGFIHRRKIFDCIFLAFDAFNILHISSFGGIIALKIDIEKAFYTLD